MKNRNPRAKGSGASSKTPPSSSTPADRRRRCEPNSDRHPSDQPKKTPADPKPSATPREDLVPIGQRGSNNQPGVDKHPGPDAASGGGGASPSPGGHEGSAGRGGGVRPPPPEYGFHMLERRSIMLADGSVRSYFALPPNWDRAADALFPYSGHSGTLSEHGLGPWHDMHFLRSPPPLRGLDGPSSLTRKYGEDDEYARHRQHVLQYGSTNPGLGRPMSPLRRGFLDDERLSKHAKVKGDGEGDRRDGDGDWPPAASGIDPKALNIAYLKFVKAINDSPAQRKNYLEDGKNGPLPCLACGRSTKKFSDVHQLIMHTYNLESADTRTDHLGLYKALCVLMGWNYVKAPDSSKAYQSLSAEIAAANREDLIVWPPSVVIHNTSFGKQKDGRMEGMGQNEMNNLLKELGFRGGKAKSMYGKEGHLGITVVTFANTEAGLKEAVRCAEYFERDNRGREGWARAQATQISVDDDQGPRFVKVNGKTGEEKRVLYGYLALAFDLYKIELDLRKKLSIRSRRDAW